MQPEMLNSTTTTPSPIPKTAILSGWTNADLLCVLGHFNRDFAMAIDTILRHDATGQPPEVLIRLLREGEVGPPQPQHVHTSSRVSLQSSSHTGSSDNGPVSLDSNASTGITTHHFARCSSHPPAAVERFPPPPLASTFSRQERVPPPHINSAFHHPDSVSNTDIVVPRRTYQVHRPGFSQEMSSFQENITSSMVNSAISRLLGLGVHRTLSQREKDEILLRVLSKRQHDTQPVAPALKPKYQGGPSPKDANMLNIQAGIEASLKETRNATTETNPEDEALAYALNASKEAFNEESKQRELRNELERKMIKTVLVKSLSDPVMKTEEELIAKAMAESLAEPVKKSEEQLIEEAMEKSLSDPVMKTEEELITKAIAESLAEPVRKSEEQLIEEAREMSLRDPIKKSEEELVDEAIRQSLHQMMPKDEELIEALAHQSFRSPSASVASMPASLRLSPNEEGTTLECSIRIKNDDPSPSALDWSLRNSEHALDSKMPAQVQAETQASDNDASTSSGKTEEV